MDDQHQETGQSCNAMPRENRNISNNSGGATDSSNNTARDSTRSAATKQRRARVSRACDECRARKTKCDGRQPCGNCEAFERYCSYHLNQGRLGTAQRSKMLEDRLRRAHAYIRDLQSQLPSSQHIDPDALFGFPPEVKDHEAEHEQQNGEEEDESDDDFESMLDGSGRITSQGDYPNGAFYGTGSGFAFLAQTKDFFDDPHESVSPGSRASVQNSKSGAMIQSAITKLFDAPLPTWKASDMDMPLAHLLPSHASATDLLRIVFDEAYPLFPFVDAQVFQDSIDRLYNKEPVEYEDSDYLFLPLFYVVMGLGMLFSRKAHRNLGCAKAVMQAMRYFIASRHMIDITRVHHLVTLQTLICFTFFLISTARLATAQTYVGIAVSASIKMGLHSTVSTDDPFTEHEAAMRRRCYWTITKLDVYTSSCLGLPPLSSPLEVEMVSQKLIDAVIKDARQTQPTDKAFPMMCAARHLELMIITAKINITLFQSKTEATPSTGKSNLRTTKVARTKVKNLENELQEWRERASELFTSETKSSNAKIIRYDLELADAFCRIILYRPFLHYFAEFRHGKQSQYYNLRYAYSCLQAAQEIIHKSQPMLDNGYLGPASWHSMYTIFMAVVAMVFYLACRTEGPERANVQLAVEMGIRLLASTTCQDTGSEKCLEVVRALLERLSSRLHIDFDELCKSTDNHNPHAKEPGEQQVSPKSESTQQHQVPRQYYQNSQSSQQSNQQQYEGHAIGNLQQANQYDESAKRMPGIEQTRQSLDSDFSQQSYAQSASSMFYDPQDEAITASVFQGGGMGHGPMDAYENIMAMGLMNGELDAAAHMYPLDAISIPFAETFAWPLSTTFNSGMNDAAQSGPLGQDNNAARQDTGRYTGGSSQDTGTAGGPIDSTSFLPSQTFPIALGDIDEFFFQPP